MKQSTQSCLAGMLLLMASSTTSAAVLQLAPSSPTVTLGDIFQVDLSVTGITAPGLASIHVDLDYDSGVLSLLNAVASNFFDLNYAGGTGSIWVDFGDPELLSGDSIDTSFSDPTTGPDQLGFDFLETNFQPSLTDGILVTLTFEAIGLGSASLSLNDILMLDDSFNSYTTGTVQNVTVLPAAAVPVPTSLLLFTLGVCSLTLSRHRRESSPAG